MKRMTMKITRCEEIGCSEWKRRTSTVSELSGEYIRNAMGIDPDDKPLDMIIGEFRKYLASIHGQDDDFGLGFIDPMAEFELSHDQYRGIPTFIVYYFEARYGIDFTWTIECPLK